MNVRRLEADGEPAFGRPTSIIPAGSAAVAQLVFMRVKLSAGEWFLDRFAGVTYFDTGSGEPRVFGGAADPGLLESSIKNVVLSTEGVSELLQFSMTFDHDTRRASVAMKYADVYGEVVTRNMVVP